MPDFTCEDKNILAMAEADLAKSGISLEMAKALNLNVVESSLGVANGQAAIIFPYWDPMTNSFTPTSDFYRAKILSKPVGWLGQTKTPKYVQPVGSLNGVYVPRLVAGKEYDWKAYLTGSANPAEPLYITEGEKKAICACMHGFRCLGLGGVDMFRAQKRGIEELPLLSKINFKNRLVYVVFDADPKPETKVRVQQATIRLMDYLAMKGAKPHAITLKSASMDKMGLDDYLMAEGVEPFLSLHAQAFTHKASVKLAKAAEQVVWVSNPGCFYEIGERIPKTKELINAHFMMEEVVIPRPAIISVPGVGKEERIVPKVTPLADALLMYGGLQRYRGVGYRPGDGPTTIIDGEPHYNLWRGWKCEYEGPKAQYAKPDAIAQVNFMNEWNWALDNVFGDDPEARAFIEHWIYYPIKFPGTKLFTFCLICSKQQGIGKTFIGDMLATYVYGTGDRGHAAMISEGQLSEQFNDYMNATSFVVGDDIAAHDKNSAYAKLKNMVTSSTTSINRKGVSRFEVENRTNLYITSNDLAPFALDLRERRVFGHVPKNAVVDNTRYGRLVQMFKDGIGGPALLAHCRESYEEGTFNPRAPAPETSGKAELVANSRGEVAEWVDGLIESASIGGLTRLVATTREIRELALIDMPYLESRLTEVSLGKALAATGACKVAFGKRLPIVTGDGSTRRERIWYLVPDLKTIPGEDLASVAVSTQPLAFIKSKVVSLKKYQG